MAQPTGPARSRLRAARKEAAAMQQPLLLAPALRLASADSKADSSSVGFSTV
jgi:hypothetical protein